MAKKSKDEKEVPQKKADRELLARIRDRLKLMQEADHHNRQEALVDMKFLHLPGEQWEPSVRAARGNRPCYEFNKTRIKAKRVVNEMRANRPSGKVRATEDNDRETAKVIEGIGRNILSVCDFDTTADYAGEYQVGAGLGAWRIITEYGEDSFDQDILVKPIANPFNLYWDPASVDPLHRDAADWCLLDRMTKDAYESKYGKKARKVDFESEVEFEDEQEWFSESGGVRIAEYHYLEPYEKKLLQLSDGRVLDAASPEGKLALAGEMKSADGQPIVVRKERTAPCNRVMTCIASGDAILEGPTELKGKYHRFIAVHGEFIIIDGKVYWKGITRHAKDPQRAYNVASTSVTETIASSPLSHYWVTEAQAKGNTAQWKRAIAQNLPFLQYTFDGKAPGPPARVGGVEVPVALVQEQQIRDQELKDVMGVYDASLGDRSNETSGRAISRRNEQGQIVNFNFPDNMAKAKQWTVTIINDMIPFYYDTERTVRVLGIDGAEDYVRINTAGTDPRSGEPILANDLTRGKYDVTVTVGPSYATQRQEASEFFQAMAPQDPALMQTAADLVYKAADVPYAEEIAERRRLMLPPPIQAFLNQKKQQPPEVVQAFAQIQSLKAELDQQGQLVQAAAAEAQKAKAAADKAVSDLNVKRAQFDTDIAKSLAQLAQKEAELTLMEAQLTSKVADTEIKAQIDGAVSDVQRIAAEALQKATAAAEARPRVSRIVRQNGALVPIYQDQEVAASPPAAIGST